MKKILKQFLAMALALAIAFTFAPVEAQAASKITTVAVGKTKKVQAKFYKGANAHSSKVTFNNVTLVGSAGGYNVYQVDFTLKNTKLSQAEANGISKEIRKKGLANWSAYTYVITNNKGQDISSQVIIDPYNSSIVNSTSTYSKKANYTVGYIRYRDKVSYYKQVKFSLRIWVPESTSGVYVGIAGLKNGQPSYTKSYAYQYQGATFTSTGYGGKKANIVATKLQ